MKILALPQPFAQFCVTRQPCDVCADLKSSGYSPHPAGCNAPMVKRMVVLPDPCPAELVGQRIALAAVESFFVPVRIGDWATAYADDVLHMYHRPSGPGIPLPLGAIVGSATIQTSLLIVTVETHPLPEGDFLWYGITSAVPYLAHSETNEKYSDQLAYDTFTPGHHAWLLDDATPTTEPIPYDGGPGLHELPDDIEGRLRGQCPDLFR